MRLNKLPFFVSALKMVVKVVSAVRFTNHKVIEAVIISDTVDVMDSLVGIQQATKMLFHKQTMLAYIARFAGVRMIGASDQDVTKKIVNSTSLPRRATFRVGAFVRKIAGVITINPFFPMFTALNFRFNKLVTAIFASSVHSMNITYYG